MAKFAKLRSHRGGAARKPTAAKANLSCGFLDAETRSSATFGSRPIFKSPPTLLFSDTYAAAPFRFARQLACTLLVPVCETSERNEGCRHASQNIHQESPPSFPSKTFFKTRASGACSFLPRAKFLDSRPALAAAHARGGASPAPRSESAGPACFSADLERSCLRGNRFVRRSARSVSPLRVSSRARFGRSFQNISDRWAKRQARELQNLHARRKR